MVGAGRAAQEEGDRCMLTAESHWYSGNQLSTVRQLSSS